MLLYYWRNTGEMMEEITVFNKEAQINLEEGVSSIFHNFIDKRIMIIIFYDI